MKLAIASDHRGYRLKKYIIKHLKDIEFIDLGSDDDKPSDYSEYGIKLGEYVVKNNIKGIAICGSGIGISIACNKVKGVRCAKVDSVEDVALTRLDNDSNVMAVSYVKDLTEIKEMVKTFLEMKFSGEARHQRRIDLINNYDN